MTRYRSRFGFSLVELLVVITIIGMLAGLLLPAIIAARESARLASCTSNVGELVKATMTYETAKNRLPGMTNAKGQTWPVQLLPYIGRMDLWEIYRDGVDTSKLVQLNNLTCPSDSDALQNCPLAALSYVANANMFRDQTSGDKRNNISISSAKSPGQTPLISERLNAPTDESNWTCAPGPWAPSPASANLIPRLGFDWPTTSTTIVSRPTVVSSNHRSVVVIGFCDGSVKKVNTADDVTLYQAGPPRP